MNDYRKQDSNQRSNARSAEDHEYSAHMRLDYALGAASLGIPVVPLQPGSKVGVCAWDDIATTDADTIERWFSVEYPNCNFGLVMGHGWLCLDLDKHESDKDGVAKMAALFPNGLTTFSVKTPTGGMHYYYRTPDTDYMRYLNGNDGIDILANGGYVVGPYATLVDNTAYVPVGSWHDVIDLPDSLVAALPGHFRPQVEAYVAGGATALPPPRPIPISGDPLSDDERVRLQRKLALIDPNLPYEPWYKVIFATLNVWGLKTGTIDELREWSRQSYKWEPRRFDEKIRSYRPDLEKRLGLASLWRSASAYPRVRQFHPLVVRAELNDLVASAIDRHCAATVNLLSAYGSIPCPDHAKALRLLSEGLVKGLFVDQELRIAYPLETGMGKTTAVIALCKTIHDLQLDKSILIACERVEQLADLREALVAAGIPNALIGLVHRSQEYRSVVPPESIDDASRFRFLLACHQRIKLDSIRGSYPDRLMEFRNGKRDLVIWDESLICAQGHFVGRDQIAHSIAAWLTGYEIALADRKATDQFRDTYCALESFLNSAKQAILAAHDQVIQLPASGLSKERTIQAIRNIIDERSPEGAMHAQRLIQLIEYAERGDVRIVRIKGDHALLQFEQAIDPAFNKIVILDASCNIRHLATYDPKLTVHPLPVTKRYTNVEIRWVPAKSSRNGFADPRHGEKHFRAYVEHLRTGMLTRYDHGWEGMIFCHQEHEDRVSNELEGLKQQTGWGVKRIHLLHWGQHRASNRYKESRWTLLWGVQYLPRSAIAAAVVGQTGRLDYGFIDREIDDLQESEIAESIYQAISRGNSRNVHGGEAGAQVIDLVLPEREMRNVQPLLEQAMPGVKITRVEPAYFASSIRANARTYLDVADDIADHLKGLPSDVARISKRDVNRALGLVANESVYRNAEEHLPMLLIGWRSDKRSFVRVR